MCFVQSWKCQFKKKKKENMSCTFLLTSCLFSFRLVRGSEPTAPAFFPHFPLFRRAAAGHKAVHTPWPKSLNHCHDECCETTEPTAPPFCDLLVSKTPRSLKPSHLRLRSRSGREKRRGKEKKIGYGTHGKKRE